MFEGLEIPVDLPAKVFLLHPVTKKPTGGWIEVYSLESPAAQAFQREIIDRRLRDKAKVATAETIENETSEMLARLTTGWALVTLDGRPLNIPFSLENALALYRNPRLAWIRAQVNDFISDLGNFLPETLKPS